MAENHKRHYYNEQDWITFYREREDAGELIDHIWLVDAGYCSSHQAARKLTSRHVKRGILFPNGSRWQSFRISHNSKNVTQHAIRRPIGSTEISDAAPSKHDTLTLNSEKGGICQSLQILTPTTSSKEHSVCDVLSKKRKPQSGAERTKRWRLRLKSQQHCTCHSGLLCEYCYNTNPILIPISAHDALYCSKIHPKLQEDPDKRFFAARDSLPDYPLQNHRTYFVFETPCEYLDPTIPSFYTLPGRNHPFRGKFRVDDILCSYEIYQKEGYTIIKPRYSHSPNQTSELHAFMQRVYAAFPHWAPNPDKWQIATVDIHRDAPTAEPGKRHVDFYHEGVKFQGYNKSLPGGKRVFRLEAQISPGCSIAEYPAVVEATQKIILNVLGVH